MRGTVDGLPTAHPLLYRLPGMYLGQEFVEGFLAGLDELLAPVLLTLDNLPAHLDPRTAPEDFLAWVAGWVAVEADADRPVAQRRAMVADAVSRHQRRGTARTLAEAIHLETGAVPELSETGGTKWSTAPDESLPGESRPWVRIELRVPDPASVDRGRLERLIAAEIPAHVGFTLEIDPA
ncbi:phage tail protein [Yinghuangia sp. YIM S09857]|uniref:phage tail protein n=1 Tax=Yinghuangia sp. YIM S09857 TaxID=3436929 RepID=UPI003F53CBDD